MFNKKVLSIAYLRVTAQAGIKDQRHKEKKEKKFSHLLFYNIVSLSLCPLATTIR